MLRFESQVPFRDSEIPLLTLIPNEDVPRLGQRLVMVYGGTKECNQREKIESFWGESLTSLGITLHCFDFRSNLNRDRFNKYGLHDRLEDTRAVFRWLRRTNGICSQMDALTHIPLSIMGVSMGGYLAALVASEYAHFVHGLILIAPAAYHDDACKPDILFGPAFSRAIRKPPNGWRECQAFKRSRTINAECLIVTYDDDEVVPREIADAYVTHMHADRNAVLRQKGYQGHHLRHEVLEGFTHRGTFDNPKKRREIRRLLCEFFGSI